MYDVNDDGTIAGRKAVMGALTLYLDFINLFLFLLRLRRRPPLSEPQGLNRTPRPSGRGVFFCCACGRIRKLPAHAA